MVSYATPGGGVGPHVDSYDVFLLQGPGRRRLARRTKRHTSRIPATCSTCRRACEHDGVALDAVLHLLDRLPRAARRRARRGVPRLAARARPARRALPRPAASRRRRGRRASRARWSRSRENVLARIRWTRGDVIAFLGRYLSSPKPHVVFSAADEPRRGRCALDPKTAAPLLRRALLHQRRSALGAPARGCAARARRPARGADKAFLAPLAGLIAEWRRAGLRALRMKGTLMD